MSQMHGFVLGWVASRWLPVWPCTPIQNAVSRAMEARADQDAIRATSDPAGYEQMLLRLARTFAKRPGASTWLLQVWSAPTQALWSG
ncbi:MAG: hypothetical protein R2709_15215 [Marmoricola sp.]